jgi:Flp pilus assembly pilin Flp
MHRGRRFHADRRGVLLVEYALIAAVTAMIAVAAIVSLGAAVTEPFHQVQMALQSALHGGHGGGGGLSTGRTRRPVSLWRN